MILLLVACEPASEANGGGMSYSHYAGAPGMHFEFRELDVDDGATLTLDVFEESWSVARGEGTAVDVPTTRKQGFFVDDTKMLPAVVEDVDAMQVYYGTFPTVTNVVTREGEWSGGSAWALDVGPIALTLHDTAFELTYYE